MRKRQSFLLTIISAENETPSFCGRVKIISSGKTCNFTTLEELYNLIAAEMGDEPASCPVVDHSPGQTDTQHTVL